MASTFGSLNIAKSGLQYQQIAIDTANNNISNVNTDGYVRRRAVAAEVGGPGQPVIWSSYDGHGQGVSTEGVQRLSELLMDKRVRTEHGNLSSLQAQQAAMERVEATINEPSDNGVAHALAAFGSAWQDVASAPDGDAARRSVIAAGQTLAVAINTQARGLASEVEQQKAAVTENVAEVNDAAQRLAGLNHSIFLAQANGSDVSDLEDQRDQLALTLANKAGAVVEAQPDGRYYVTVGGYDLVPKAGNGMGTPDVANMLVAKNLETSGDPDVGASVTFDMFTVADPSADPLVPGAQVNVPTPPSDPSATASPNPVSITSGELGGESVLLNHTLKNYRGQLNDLAVKLADVVNAQHGAGFDQQGNAGGDFFTPYDPAQAGGAAAQLAVQITDPKLVATASSVQYESDGTTPIPNTDSTNADQISQALLGKPTTAVPTTGGTHLDADGNPINAVNVNDLYQGMVTGLGSTVAGLNTQTTNQQLLTNQVDDEREQTVGVSLDEETINLMAAQRAYQASSRVLSVMDNILDTLINRTGV